MKRDNLALKKTIFSQNYLNSGRLEGDRLKISNGKLLVIIFALLWVLIILFFSIQILGPSGIVSGIAGTVATITIGTMVYSCYSIIKKQETITQYFAETYKDTPKDKDSEDYRYQMVRRPIPGVTRSIIRITPESRPKEGQVRILRGGEFIGNRMRYKVKVQNDSEYLIADVTVYLLSYPQDALKFEGQDSHVFFSKIEPGGLRSPTFDFLPTQDCVKGEIVAGVSYIDMKGQPHTLTARPFIIRSVCDLLLPQRITPKDFELKLTDLECGEVVFKIEEWTPTEMFEKALRIVDESNFFEVSSELEEVDSIEYAKIVGFAQGKYTGKEVGVQIDISGPSGKKGASCKIRVSGEDQAMILPAIDDLRERLSAWLCPVCSSPLSLAQVEDIQEGRVVECPFCNVTIGR
ncbi:MAG: hypothetical protein ACFFEK_03605 [Candidatus Thorarchaeota archaeon]